jgi:hypothetical protein
MTVFPLKFNSVEDIFQHRLVAFYCSRDETAPHALLYCQYATEVWSEIKTTYNIHLRRKFFTSSKTWLFEFLSRSSDKECTVLAVAIWHLWLARNGARNGEVMMHPHCVAERVKAYVEMIELYVFSPYPSTLFILMFDGLRRQKVRF